jgi:hypothetical protein
METTIVVAGEIRVGNNRVAVIPYEVPSLWELGFRVSVESGCGRDTLWPDRASAVSRRRGFLSMSGIVLGIHGQRTMTLTTAETHYHHYWYLLSADVT